MTRFLSLAALCGVLSSTASAAASHPTAADADGDGAYVATVDVNGDGTKDHLDIGVRKSEYDCNDNLSTESPYLEEIVDDGLDNNCSGEDAQFQEELKNPAVRARYHANSGTRGNDLKLIIEWGRCNESEECEVYDGAGTMKIFGDAIETHVFLDLYCGDSKALGADGYREVVTKEEASYDSGKKCPTTKKGGGAGSSRGGSSSGTTGGASRSYVDGSTRVLREETTKAVDGLRSELSAAEKLRADEEKQSREVQTAVDKDQDESIVGLEVRMDALETEEGGRFVEAGFAGVVMFGSSVTDRQGMIARDGTSPGAGLSLSVGTDDEDARSAVFFTGTFAMDAGFGMNGVGGVEHLWIRKFAPVKVGLNVGYAQRETYCDGGLYESVTGRMLTGGLSVAAPFGKNGIALVHANPGLERVTRDGDVPQTNWRAGGYLSAGLVTRF